MPGELSPAQGGGKPVDGAFSINMFSTAAFSVPLTFPRAGIPGGAAKRPLDLNYGHLPNEGSAHRANTGVREGRALPFYQPAVAVA